jgi:hypothetical protein
MSPVSVLQAKHHPDLIMCMKQPGIGEQLELRAGCAAFHHARRASNRLLPQPGPNQEGAGCSPSSALQFCRTACGCASADARCRLYPAAVANARGCVVLCALQPLAACVRSVTASAPSATHMCAQPRLCEYVMSATMAHTRADVSSVEAWVCQTHTTARSARYKRRM